MDKDVIDLSNIKLPNLSPRIIFIAVAVLLGVVVVMDSVYQVQPEEVGIIRRLGRYNAPPRPPGLQFKLPFIDTVVKVPVQRQLKQEFGFRTQTAGQRTIYSPQDFLGESLMLTGDLNVAVVEWIVQYRVSDPYKYLFRVRNVEETFRAMTEAVMRGVIGDRTVTEVLTVGRQEIETTVKVKLQELCNQYETGITIDQVVLQDVNPPDPVKPSWDQVNQAQQQRDQLINEAKGEYNRVIPRAEGEALQTILQAQGYALDRVNRAEGDATRFKALYAAYRLSPQVTRRRMYLETMAKVLPKMGGKLYIDKDAQGVMPLLPLETLRGLTGSSRQGGE
ncbi:MAG: FtsH protease activity modulator HflK [Acidobacteria bacterium]|nr:FtsH protease activity modulator HflK [Acidobacteriota bacterium]